MGNLRALDSPNEQDTKRLLVEPLLAWAGLEVWAWGDHPRLTEEYPVPHRGGRHADYAILTRGGRPYILLEAKPLGSALVPAEVEQLVDYCHHRGVRFGVLTDGRRWLFLDDDWKDKIARERVLFELDLADRPDDSRLLPLLHPDNAGHLEHLAQEIRKFHMAKVSNIERHIRTELDEVAKVLMERTRKSSSETEGQPGRPFIELIGKLIGKKPPERVYVGSRRLDLKKRTWTCFLESVAEFLVAEGKLRAKDRVGFHPSLRRSHLYIVSPEPVHANGNRFYVANRRLSNGLYLELGWEADNCVKAAVSLLLHCGYPEDALRVPEDYEP